MDLVYLLKAIADQKRLEIIKMLISGNLCVGALAGRLNISKPAVSQHLKVLRNVGLVRCTKQSYWTHYMVDKEALIGLAERLRDLASYTKPDLNICRRIDIQNPEKEVNMCNNCCWQPEKLLDKPENCTLEQILDCHGKTENHPCIADDMKTEEK